MALKSSGWQLEPDFRECLDARILILLIVASGDADPADQLPVFQDRIASADSDHPGAIGQRRHFWIVRNIVVPDAKGSREGGLEVMTSLLAANPKIDGVFAINDPTAIGADLAAKQAQRSEFFIVGVDGSPDGEEALKRKNSLFVATPAQDPQVMAAKAVEIGYDILQGKPAPTAPVLIPVTMIDKNNVSSYKGWTVK